MTKFLEKVRRSAIWQVMIVYIGASWVLLQAIDVFADNLELPGWLFPTAGILLLIGLPIILATAFIQRRLAASGEVADEAHEKLFTWRNALLGGAAAFLLLFGFAGLYVVIQDRGETFRPDDALADEVVPGVAVLPFSVRVPDHEHWREGMIDALYANLEGISDLRPISSGTVLARWREKAAETLEVDEATQTEIARSTGARYAVSGSVVGTPESIRINGTVVDLTDGMTLGRPSIEGSSGDMMDLVDRFSVETVRTIGLATEGELNAIDLSQATTGSPDALRHYLIGNSRFRRGEIDRAEAALRSAVSEDSIFALAWLTLARVLDSRSITIEDESVDSVDLLLRTRRLTKSPRLDLLARGLLAELWAVGRTAPGFDRELADATIAELEATVRRDPSDADAWQILGEWYYHSWPSHPHVDARAQAVAAFERSAELEPDFLFNQIHLYRLYYRTQDRENVAGLLAANARSSPDEPLVRARALIARLAFGALPEDQREAALDSVANIDRGLSHLRHSLGAHPAYAATNLGAMERLEDEGCWWPAIDAGDLESFLQRAAAITDSVTAAECYYWLYATRHLIPFAELESAVARPTPSHPWAAKIAAFMGEFGTLESAIEAQRDSLASMSAGADSARAWHEGTLTTMEALLHWKRDGSPEKAANRILSAMPSRLRLDQQFLATEMLRDAGRVEDAALRLQLLVDFYPLPIFLYHLAPLYEELGEPAKARTAYAEFVDRWKNADPRLQPMVDTARAALARLGPIDQ